MNFPTYKKERAMASDRPRNNSTLNINAAPVHPSARQSATPAATAWANAKDHLEEAKIAARHADDVLTEAHSRENAAWNELECEAGRSERLAQCAPMAAHANR
jgi:hypothetical protein